MKTNEAGSLLLARRLFHMNFAFDYCSRSAARAAALTASSSVSLSTWENRSGWLDIDVWLRHSGRSLYLERALFRQED